MFFYYLKTQAFVAWHLKINVLLAIPDIYIDIYIPDSAHPIRKNVHYK